MGTWGNGLYENDISLDVKDQFEEQFRNGKNVDEITKQLIKEFESTMDVPDEEALFWLALADTQWDWGVLLPDVKERAIQWIEKCNNKEVGKKNRLLTVVLDKRMLEGLHNKLLSPQPSAKKARKRRVYKCEWNIGDVFAYQLESELAKERGLFGKYFLIQKVDEGSWHPGHIVPIVYVKITKNEKLPTNIDEYNELEYVQTCFTKYENRFWPIDGRRPQEDIAEKSKMNYEVDEYGYLPQFRIRLLNISKKVIPSTLIFIGNYVNTIPPKNEFIPHVKVNIQSVFWKNFDETFETKMIKLYCGHNLRELKSYLKD